MMDRAACYSICLHGVVTRECEERLGGLKVADVKTDSELPVTVLSGRLPDQAALAGVLTCLYEYGLPLLSVERSEDSELC
jgi:hypothetical protein